MRIWGYSESEAGLTFANLRLEYESESGANFTSVTKIQFLIWTRLVSKPELITRRNDWIMWLTSCDQAANQSRGALQILLN